MSEVLQEFIKFNKVLGVELCNHISSQLKFSLVVSEFSGGLKEYNTSVSTLEKLNFIAQYSYQNRGIMFCINSKIIELSTQRCFGGTDKVDSDKKIAFSFSEKFVGKEIVHYVTNYFTKIKSSVDLTKIEYFIDRSHLFFSDEQVVFIDMKCSVNKENVGSISFFYPLVFVKQERDKWLLDA